MTLCVVSVVVDGCSFVDVDGVLAWTSGRELRERLALHLGRSMESVVDLSGVEQWSLSVQSAFVGALRTAASQGRRVSLCGLRGEALRQAEASGLLTEIASACARLVLPPPSAAPRPSHLVRPLAHATP